MRLALLFLLFSSSVFAQLSPTEMEKTLRAKPSLLATRIQLGNYYLKQKNYAKVVELLNSYTDQLTPEGFLALASAYSHRGEFIDEVRVLNLLTMRQPENYQWPYLLAQAYRKQMSIQKDYLKKKDIATQAIQSYRKSLSLKKDFKPAFNDLLTTLLQQKANNEARELVQEGITRFGERPELYRELCRLDANDGFLDSAVATCRKAINLAPAFPDNHVFLMQALHDQKEDKMAEANAVSAAKKFPRSEFVQWAAGTLFFKKKNFPVAARYFQTAVNADPKSSRAHFGLAQAIFESNQEAASLEHFTKACAADPTTLDTFLAAGGRLKQKGNTQLGEKFIHAAYTCK